MVLSELSRLHWRKEVEFEYKGAVLKGTLVSVSHMETFTCFTLRSERNEFRIEIDGREVDSHLITVFK